MPSPDQRSPVVVALHSLGLQGQAFVPLVQATQGAGMRWITPDLPGHGGHRGREDFALQDCVDQVLQELRGGGVDSLHLVGHSMGGTVAALVAKHCAGDASLPRVLSLTLLASPPKGLPLFAERGQAALAQGMPIAAEATLQRWFGPAQTAAQMQTQTPQSASYQLARNSLLAMTARAYDAAWKALTSFEGYALLAPDLPSTLAIAAEQDLSTPPVVMRAIGEMFEHAGCAEKFSLATVDGGHLFPLTPSEELVELLVSHWHRNEGTDQLK